MVLYAAGCDQIDMGNPVLGARILDSHISSGCGHPAFAEWLNALPILASFDPTCPADEASLLRASSQGTRLAVRMGHTASNS